jgi:hypothetical protein
MYGQSRRHHGAQRGSMDVNVGGEVTGKVWTGRTPRRKPLAREGGTPSCSTPRPMFGGRASHSDVLAPKVSVRVDTSSIQAANRRRRWRFRRRDLIGFQRGSGRSWGRWV